MVISSSSQTLLASPCRKLLKGRLPAVPLSQKPANPEQAPYLQITPTPANKKTVSINKTTAMALLAPSACGIYAGLASGKIAALAGALAATPGAALLGGLSGALISQHLFKARESTTVTATIAGGISAGLLGLAGGAYLGFTAGSIWQAAGLGALGLASGGLLLLN